MTTLTHGIPKQMMTWETCPLSLLFMTTLTHGIHTQMMTWETCPYWAHSSSLPWADSSFLSQKQQGGLLPPALTDLLNANSLFQRVSLGPSRTPYSQASLLTYRAPVPRKPVLSWAQGYRRRSPRTQLLSEFQMVQIPYQNIRQPAAARLLESSLKCRHKTFAPQAPKAMGKAQMKEGIYIRASSISHGVSSEGLSLDPENQQAPNYPQGLPCLPLS